MKTLITFLLLCLPASAQDLYAETDPRDTRIAELEQIVADLTARLDASVEDAGDSGGSDVATPPAADAPVVYTSDYATPQDSVDRMLAQLKPQSSEVFLDVGSGDGRVVIAAARDYGCRAYGIERDHDRVLLARRNAEAAGVSDLVTIIEGDFNEVDWPDADVGFAYLFPVDLAPIRDKLLRLDRFATFAHQVPDLPMWSYGEDFYVWDYDQAFVMWQGQARTGRVCNRPNCTMCNAIAAGVSEQRSHRQSELAEREPESAQDSGQYRLVRRCNGRQCWHEWVRVD